jgi:hypothetical protein
MSPTQITEERNPLYADAWRIQGEVCQNPDIQAILQTLLNHYPFMWFPWIMILNKLLRVSGSPTKIDHWDDIIGYATLVRDHLTNQGGSK